MISLEINHSTECGILKYIERNKRQERQSFVVFHFFVYLWQKHFFLHFFFDNILWKMYWIKEFVAFYLLLLFKDVALNFFFVSKRKSEWEIETRKLCLCRYACERCAHNKSLEGGLFCQSNVGLFLTFFTGRTRWHSLRQCVSFEKWAAFWHILFHKSLSILLILLHHHHHLLLL